EVLLADLEFEHAVLVELLGQGEPGGQRRTGGVRVLDRRSVLFEKRQQRLVVLEMKQLAIFADDADVRRPQPFGKLPRDGELTVANGEERVVREAGLERWIVEMDDLAFGAFDSSEVLLHDFLRLVDVLFAVGLALGVDHGAQRRGSEDKK